MTDGIKLIAVDMDGTLLRSDKTVDPLTIQQTVTGLAKIHSDQATGLVADWSSYSRRMMAYCVCQRKSFDYNAALYQAKEKIQRRQAWQLDMNDSDIFYP